VDSRVAVARPSASSPQVCETLRHRALIIVPASVHQVGCGERSEPHRCLARERCGSRSLTAPYGDPLRLLAGTMINARHRLTAYRSAAPSQWLDLANQESLFFDRENASRKAYIAFPPTFCAIPSKRIVHCKAVVHLGLTITLDRQTNAFETATRGTSFDAPHAKLCAQGGRRALKNKSEIFSGFALRVETVASIICIKLCSQIYFASRWGLPLRLPAIPPIFSEGVVSSQSVLF
jgi:hypothetical protein